ncbi:glutathione transferase GstA [Microbulbifer hydrolyticus]|uniref:Glutathione S-transferase n=1 Tax=Microbulbifer hydrolyticus TaxID=48074 RepID=A0A6P1T697_9GAMM|nr:glutathione transferase GstA [Microbulbifer hydrolyticus]MBB5211714.1 glutathione S-transferase [Microbulbifer hydrolyticus]QHQ37557.1 glutathione transferase GstA [Microbulbifer hydrolyticus]
MKLFYAPGACSLSPHIVACEAGIELELCKVNLKDKKTESGGDYTEINPKGYVPALQLEGGELLTEGPAIIQFLAEQKPEKNLAPEYGSLAHYRVLEWLNYISTEVHKAFVPLFWDGRDEEKADAREKLAERFQYVEDNLNSDYLMGDDFCIADAYLFTVYSWCDKVGVDTGSWPKLKAFAERMSQREGVQKAMKDEGLI